jgi:hypothetical protein
MLKRSAVLAAGLLMLGALTGCLVIGHTSGGGWFIWPGGLGLLFVVLFVLFLLRRR